MSQMTNGFLNPYAIPHVASDPPCTVLPPTPLPSPEPPSKPPPGTANSPQSSRIFQQMPDEGTMHSLRRRIARAGMELDEEQIALVEERYNALHQRLLGMAVAMGRETKMYVEFEPLEKSASMLLEDVRIFRIGVRSLLHETTKGLLMMALHEGGHADITRYGSGFFFQHDKLFALFGIMEDIRVNARVIDRAPGIAAEFQHDRHERYLHLDPGLKQLLPHEAYLAGALSREYGGRSPWDDEPLVGPALDATWEAIQRAKALRPREDEPDEASVLSWMMKFETVLRREILPIYERLYLESLAIVAQRLEHKQQESNEAETETSELVVLEAGTSEASTIDAEDLPNAAQRALEQRAHLIAEAFRPKGTLGERFQQETNVRALRGHAAPREPEHADLLGGTQSLGYALRQRQRDRTRQDAQLRELAFSRHLASLGTIPVEVFQALDQYLKPNADCTFEGHYPSGPRADVQLVVRAMHGMLSHLNLYLRRTMPNEYDYRFSLLLDASHSMMEPERERGGMGLAAVFIDSFERLDLHYALSAFHHSYVPIKGFESRLRGIPERNALFSQIEREIWGKGGTNIRAALRREIERIREARRHDPRDREFLIVLTDGDETQIGGEDIPTLCHEAAQDGIIVVGMGIGEGMQTVRKHFPIHMTTRDPRKLPLLLGEFLRTSVMISAEER